MAELRFTDERFVPMEKARITHEYYHRYAACLEAGAGKTVLDFACGEGLGSALLASRAAKVIGVDIDPATIRHGNEKYCPVTNATFVVRDGQTIPLAENSVDFIVLFKTIEYMEEHEQLLKEFLRVLHPSGGIIVSRPDREHYNEKPGHTNPYHVQKLTHEQFVCPFRDNSCFVHLYRQRLAIASLVLADAAKGSKLLQSSTVGKRGVEPGSPPLRGSLYSLVFCSNNEATSQLIGSLVHLDLEDDLYLEQERVLRWAN
jgi:SAM-dependent methyltransferase